MNDPAVGKTRAQRSGVAKSNMAPKNEKRNKRIGQFSGPRPSYVPYEVSEQAQDILNRQFRTYNR